MRGNFLSNIESQSFTTFATNITGILGYLASDYVVAFLNNLKPEQFNQYPYTLIIYYRSLIVSHIGTAIVYLYFFNRSEAYRRMLREELSNILNFWMLSAILSFKKYYSETRL
jgi:hypothetical protein